MMKLQLWVILALAILMVGCKNSKNNSTQPDVIGTLKNTENLDTINIYGYLFYDNMALKDSAFASDKTLPYSAYYILDMDQQYTVFYYDKEAKEKELGITADFNNFENSLKFTGNSAKENQYIYKRLTTLDTLVADSEELYAKNEKEFIQQINTYRSQAKQLMNGANLNKKFVSIETKNIDYIADNVLYNYESYHKDITEDPNFMISDSLKNAIAKIDMDNDNDIIVYRSYQDLVMNSFYEYMDKNSEGNDDYSAAGFKYVENLKSGNVRNFLLDQFTNFLSPSNKNNKAIYDKVMALTTDKMTKEKITETYKNVQKLNTGAVAPGFNFENYKGGKTSLADFKGKYVYIDVWATWCGPCKQEIPYLKKVEDKYKGKNIAFVSISIDSRSDTDKWKEMVKNENLQGEQLIADNDWNSKFVKDYMIQGIPTFILIDKEGKLISAGAYRPSNPKLTPEIDSLLALK